MQNKKKIVFIGGQYLGSSIFEEFLLARNIDIGLVYELELDEHEVENFITIADTIETNQYICKYKRCKKINLHDLSNIEKYKPDYIFVINWRTLFDDKLLNMSKYGVIGIHASDLPKYRGFSPINWAIINGENKIGISIFYLDKEVDSGNIIKKNYIDILENDDIASVIEKVKEKYIDMFRGLLSNLKSIKSISQKGEITYTSKRRPEDGMIDFNLKDSLDIYNLIRALKHPYPMAFFKYKNNFIFVNDAKIKKCKNYVGIIPGRIVFINKVNGHVDILCRDGYILELIEVFKSEALYNKAPIFFKPLEILNFGDTAQ